MNGITQYFTPVDLGGLQRFTQGGTAAGWYQFNRPGMLVTALPGITIPEGATGILIQAVSNINYCQSPTAAAAATTAYFTLYAGSFIFLPGQEAINQFCVLLPASGAQFAIQWHFGSIGPLPLINQPSSGGIVPPPPPGLSAIPTINVVHVMKSSGGIGGNDTTGTRNRMDLPFLTPDVAELVMQAGDTMVIWPGSYTAANLGTQVVTRYMLIGATLVDNGTDSIFDTSINNNAIEIVGDGILANVGAPYAAQFGGVTLAEVNVTSDTAGIRAIAPLTMVGDITANGGNGLEVVGAPLRYTGTINATGQALTASGTGTERGTITGTFASGTAEGVAADNYTLDVYGVVLNTAGAALYAQSGAIINAWADVRSTGDDAVHANGATINLQGNVTGVRNPLMANNGGTITGNGNVVASGNGGITADGGAVAWSGLTIGVHNALQAQGGGSINYTGRLQTNSSTGLAAIGCADGSIDFDGVLEDTSGGGINTNDPAAEVSFRGTMVTEEKCMTCTAGSLDFDGDATSISDFGATILAGMLRLRGSIDSFRSCVEVQDDTATFTVILGSGLLLISQDVTCVYSLTGNPCDVKVYTGVASNKITEPVNIVQLINTVDVDALYE